MYKVSSINAIIRAIFPSKCHYLQKSREKPMGSREKTLTLHRKVGRKPCSACVECLRSSKNLVS